MIAALMRRSPAERMLLMSTALLFVFAGLLLRLYSLQKTRNKLRALATTLRIVAADVQQLTWCIDRVQHRLPGRHSCLVTALVCDAVATASGIPVDFRLGAARGETSHRFHAWIEFNGSTIIGIQHASFTPFPNF
jgi:hypothetical protein